MLKRIAYNWSGYNEVEEILQDNPGISGERFIGKAIEKFQVRVEVPSDEGGEFASTIFLCTHHTGALDFLAVFPFLSRLSSNLKVVVNKSILKLDALKSISIGVNPLSSKKTNFIARSKISEHLKSGGNILLFPSGKVGSSEKGSVSDSAWQKGIFSLLKQCKSIVCVFVDAQNSSFFYMVRKRIPKLSPLFMLRALKKRKKRVVPIYMSKPLEAKKIYLMEPTDAIKYLRDITYQLQIQNKRYAGK